MPTTTLTLEDVPEAVFERLKASAELHRRSLSSEAILLLQLALMHETLLPASRLNRIRSLRQSLGTARFEARDIDAMKHRGHS